MKRMLMPLVALGFVVLATAAPAEQAADSDRAYPIAAQESVGPWTVLAANDRSGVFHHCELSRVEGSYQINFLRGRGGYVFLVANPAWRLPDNAHYTVGLEGDGLARTDFQASSAGSAGILILFGEERGIIGKLGKVGTLRLHAAQSVIPLKMDGAGTGFEHLDACWTHYAGSMPNPFASPGAEPTGPNPFEGAAAPAAGDGFTIAVPRLSASGANLSEAEIGTIFKGDFGRLAELTADRVTVPEIVARFAGAGDDPVEIAYRDVSFSGVVDGKAASAAVGSIEFRSAGVGMTFRNLTAGQLDISGLLAFYGLVPAQAPDTQYLLYKDFAIAGADMEIAGARCRLGAVQLAEFSGRPLHFTPAQSMQLMRDVDAANGALTPAQLGAFARLYADYLTAFRSEPTEVAGFSCSAKNSGGKTVTITADRLGVEGLQPSRFPGVEVRNLKLSVEGKGSFSARALILKPADASALVTKLVEAGDAPDPGWLAANARTLIPAFEGMQLAGVALDVPHSGATGEPLHIGLDEADLSLRNYREGIPSDVKLTAFGVGIPVTGKQAKPLADMGYRSLDLGVILSTHWNPDSGIIAVDQLALSGQKMGSVALAATLTDATPDLFSGDRMQALGAALHMGVKAIDLTVNDAGLRDRLIGMGAASAGLDARTFTAGLVTLARQYVPQGRSWSDDVEKAMAAFIEGAPSINLALRADAPVPAVQLIAAKSNPAGLLDLFSVTANAAH